jgi:hypothetical protein
MLTGLDEKYRQSVSAALLFGICVAQYVATMRLPGSAFMPLITASSENNEVMPLVTKTCCHSRFYSSSFQAPRSA